MSDTHETLTFLIKTVDEASGQFRKVGGEGAAMVTNLQARLKGLQGDMTAISRHPIELVKADQAARVATLEAQTARLNKTIAASGVATKEQAAQLELLKHKQIAANTAMDAGAVSAGKHHTALTKLTGGVLGLGAAFVFESAKAAVKWDEFGKKIQQQTGMSEAAVRRLQATVLAAGQRTPYSLQQIADASVVLKTRFHESDAQIQKTAGLMDAFAQRVGGDVEPTVNQLGQIMHDFRTPLGQVVGLTDKLVGVADATHQPLGDLLGTVDRFGPKFQAMGFGLNDTIKLLGVFQDAGVSTSTMGRGLAAALTNAQKAQKALGGSAGDAQQIIGREMLAIEHAKTRQDAWNLAMNDFGKNLGPSFLRALYNNKAGFDAVATAMGKGGETQHLFNIQAGSLQGQLQMMHNNFQDLEIMVGTKVLPVLSKVTGWMVGAVRDVDNFVKHNKTLIEVLGGVAGVAGAAYLGSRAYSGIASRLAGAAAGRGQGLSGIGAALGGGGAGGETWGAIGPLRPGSLANPIMVRQEGGGGGGVGTPKTTGSPADTAARGGLLGALGGAADIGGLAGAAGMAAIVAPIIIANQFATNYSQQAQAAIARLHAQTGAIVSPDLAATAGVGTGSGRSGAMPWTPDVLKLIQDSDKAIKSFGSTGNAAGIQAIIDRARALEREWPQATKGANELISTLQTLAFPQSVHGFDRLKIAIGQVEPEFQAMSAAAGKSLSVIQSTVASTTANIKHVMGVNSAAARAALATNFVLAADDIRRSMNAGVIATDAGLKAITKLFDSAMRQFGLTPGKSASAAQAPALQTALNLGIAQTYGPTGLVGAPAMAIGGKVTRPGYFAGEEAPQHPEYILATNPAYRQRNTQLWAKAGRELGIPGFATGGWVRTGASIDPTQGQAPTYSAHGGWSFAELLEAGQNAGVRPDATQLLGLPRGAYGMPMETSILARSVGGGRGPYRIWKNDVGSGQGGNAHYTIDLHSVIANALGVPGLGDIEIARDGTASGAPVSGAAGIGAPAVAPRLRMPRWTGPGGAVGAIGRAVLAKYLGAANAKLAAAAPRAAAGGAAGGGGGIGAITGGGGGSALHNLFGAGTTYSRGRTDAGIDFSNIHGPIGAITAGAITGFADNPGGFGHTIFQSGTGPGGFFYYALETGATSVARVGPIAAGAPVAMGSGGGVIEVGLSKSGDFGGIDQSHIGPGHLTRGGQQFQAYLGLARGGRYAGAFGGGGAVTAHGPTAAIFGENGPETAVFLPHFQAGGIPGVPQVGVAPHHTRPPHHTTGGARMRYFHHRPVGVMTEAQWQAYQLAHGVHHPHTPAHDITVTSPGLGVVGTYTGSGASTVSLAGDMQKLTTTAWNRIVAAIDAALKSASLGRSLRISDVFSHREHGPRMRDLAVNVISRTLTAVTTAGGTAVSLAQSRGQHAVLLNQLGVAQANLGRPLDQQQTADTSGLRLQALAAAGQLGALNTEHGQLARLLKDAQRTHNKQLVDSVKRQLATVDDAIAQAKLDTATLQEQFRQAIHDAFMTGIDNVRQALEAGASLLGTQQQVAEATQHLQGGNLTDLQAFAGQQGGQLTPAQRAQAQADLAQFTANAQGQIGAFAAEIGVEQQALANPLTTATDRAALQQTIADLTLKILQLQGSIQDNTTATAALTGATTTNTNALNSTQTFGGSVGFNYQSQDYVAGGQSSTVPASVALY